MQFRCLIMAGLLLFAASPLLAQEMDVTLSNDSAQLRYIKHSNAGFGNSELDFGVLYTSSNDLVGMVGLQVVDQAGSGSPGLNVGMGVKGFVGNMDTFDLAAVSVGGQLRYAPPSLPRVGLGLELFYAPNIVTFMDADNFIYSSVRLEYELLSQAKVYLGYRNVKADVRGQPDKTIDSDTHLGMQVVF